jgi:hypothetical protein
LHQGDLSDKANFCTIKKKKKKKKKKRFIKAKEKLSHRLYPKAIGSCTLMNFPGKWNYLFIDFYT